ncbi:MAG: BamA/TamA family outer membrane protein [Candidatus Bipolaricaulota bacterium]|nr:BamA/TamA family outer membrane protein [Candidatus Bipolaricaulota bacterium]MDW8110864.1 POTRA domain-containing protein [Candidatus Bipolaricaulota bacterium]
MKRAVWVTLAVTWLMGSLVGFAQETEKRYVVRNVVITGTKALTRSELYEALPFRLGDAITLADVERGAQVLRDLGPLESVQSDYKELGNGIRVIYNVVENPTVKKIEFEGNETYQFYLIDIFGIRWIPYKLKLARRDELIDALREAKPSVEEGRPLNIRWFDDKVIENTIVQFYQKKGYAFIGVDARFNRDKQILTIQIVEGKLDSVEVRGLQEVPESYVKPVIEMPVGEPIKIERIQNALRFFNRSIYFESPTEKTLQIEQGSKPNTVKIIWNLQERRLLESPTEIRQIQLKGMTVYPKERLQSMIGKLPNGPVNNYQLNTALKRIFDLYRVEGYLLVDFVRESLSDGVLTLRINEGRIVKVTISNPCPKNLKSTIIPKVIEFERQCTPEIVIRKALRLKEGDLVNENPLRDSYRNIVQLGYFQQNKVQIEPKVLDRATGEVELFVGVAEEDQLGNLKGGVSYNPQVGIVGQVSLGWKNILGTAQDIDLSFDRGLIGRPVTNYKISYTTRAYFREFSFFEISVFDTTEEKTDPQKHFMTKRGATFGVGYPLGANWELTLRFRHENVYLSEPFDKQSLIVSLSLDLMHDTRNNPIFPTSGGQLALMAEQAGKFAVGDEFTKTQVFWTHHWRTLDRQTISVRLQAAMGWTLPSQERFGFGGVNTVRGFGMSLTNSFALANLEYRFELIENVWGVFFYDLGVGEGVGWRYSFGFELRPVAPVIGNVRLVIVWPALEGGIPLAPVFQFGLGTLF